MNCGSSAEIIAVPTTHRIPPDTIEVRTLKSVATRPLVDPPVERAVVAVEVRGRKRSPPADLFFQALHAHRWLKTAAPVVTA